MNVRLRPVCAVGACIAAISLLAGCTGHTLPATGIGPTSATLNAAGSCDTNCSVRFKYREVSPSLGNWKYTAPFSAGGTNGKEVPFADYATNLAQGATYQYQVCGQEASDPKETCVGPDRQTTSYSYFKTRVRLMTYNIEHLAETGASLEPIKQDIINSKASVVALQETKKINGQPSDAEKLVSLLGWNTGGTHFYFSGWTDPNEKTDWCNGPATSCQGGVAIVSRFPLANSNWHYLTWWSGTLHRKIIWADVQVGAGQTLRVYATHLAANVSPYYVVYPQTQLSDAVAFIEGQNSSGPVAFMGDFNLSRDEMGPAYGDLKGDGFADWKDSKVGSNDPPCGTGAVYACTYPSSNPYEKIDWIWVKSAFDTAGTVVNNCASSCTSDHRPYWTDIAY